MSDINSVTLTGRLTRDPELRATAGGTSVLSFGLAVSDSRKNQQTGQWEDYANYIECTMFGSRADSLNNILRKGMPVTVCGSLRWSSWEKDGQKRSKVEVIVQNLVLPPKGSGQQTAQPNEAQQVVDAYYSGAGAAYDEEIPF